MTQPFPTAWYSIELRGYREPPGLCTYHAYAYEELPPAPEGLFDGSFRWLPPDGPRHSDGQEWYEPGILAGLADQAAGMGLALPRSFLDFMRSAELPGRIRSVTDCGFELPGRIVPVPWASGALVRFLADSQGCLFWYLFLRDDGGHGVVSSPEFYGGDPHLDSGWDAASYGPEGDEEDEEPPSADHEIRTCAPDFESFIHRFWLENQIWLALARLGGPADDEQRRDLQHDRRPPAAP